MQTFNIAKGVTGTFIKNKRFKNSLITVSFFIKPLEEEVSAFSLLTSLMASGCKEFPNFTLLNRKLDSLYGADIIKSTALFGDFRMYSLSIKAINDTFSEQGNLKESAELLSELCFGYYLSKKYCEESDLLREKRILKEKIASSLNEKRIYATEKLKSIMCKGEPYGYASSGTEDQVEQTNTQTIINAYNRFVQNAIINIQFCGSSLPENFFNIFEEKLKLINRSPSADFEQIIKSADSPKTVTEEMEIAQGKLIMGFRSGEAVTPETAIINTVMCDIFGGGPYSKLFMNVREKLSLCYYCSSSLIKRKNIMLVSSGVEKCNIEKAKEEILNQFENIKNGNFSDELITASKTAIITSANAAYDDLESNSKWYLSRLTEENPLSPEEFVNKVQSVTKEQILNAARNFNLDTVFILSPKEEN